jgi:hypothetical protein
MSDGTGSDPLPAPVVGSPVAAPCVGTDRVPANDYSCGICPLTSLHWGISVKSGVQAARFRRSAAR